MPFDSDQKDDFVIVSSASRSYYDSVGFRLEESLRIYEPDTVFYFYSEEPFTENEAFRLVDLKSEAVRVEQLQDIENARADKNQGIKYKIFPFYYKVLAIRHAYKQLADKYRYLVWLDADCVLVGRSEIRDLIDVVRQVGATCGYFGRPYYKCSETGLIIFATNGAESLISAWADSYSRISEFEEWHDAYLFSRVVSAEALDFCNHYELTSNHPVSELCGHWLDHQKGGRKGIGGSRLQDVYWSSAKNRLKRLFGRA